MFLVATYLLSALSAAEPASDETLPPQHIVATRILPAQEVGEEEEVFDLAQQDDSEEEVEADKE